MYKPGNSAFLTLLLWKIDKAEGYNNHNGLWEIMDWYSILFSSKLSPIQINSNNNHNNYSYSNSYCNSNNSNNSNNNSNSSSSSSSNNCNNSSNNRDIKGN